jgi:deoxyribonuclease-4
MAILGAHMSIAGGYHRSVEAARQAGCDCVQLFTKNNNQWRAKDISATEAEDFAKTLYKLNVLHPLSHSSYLINLAAPDRELWMKSIDAFIVELRRAETLGIPYVVVHPGSFTTSTEEAGIRRIAAALSEAHRQTLGSKTQCLLETTAGQGSSIGHTFEQLASILDATENPDRIGICFDTCHVFAAGYPLGTKREYDQTMRIFQRVLGLKLIKAFHLNDSKREMGSRVDRHEHIGRGLLGVEAFRHLLNDSRFRKVPMYLETPKGEKNRRSWDRINLSVLRKLIV